MQDRRRAIEGTWAAASEAVESAATRPAEPAVIQQAVVRAETVGKDQTLAAFRTVARGPARSTTPMASLSERAPELHREPRRRERQRELARAGLVAVAGACTHYGGPLGEGLATGDQVRCPWHHACFSLRTGEALAAPTFAALARWRIAVEDDKVFLR